MNKMKLILSILFIPLGVFIFVYGGYDDSPGAQGLGLLLVAIGVVNIIKRNKKTKQS